MSIDAADFKIVQGKKVSLKDYDSAWVPKWAQNEEEKEGKKAVKEMALAFLKENKQKLFEMQQLFWASDTYSMLIVLQGMDTAGKDGTIRHVMSGLNPQGCQVNSFKTPTEEELNHDFLWRQSRVLPERGRIGIFNRSYYEDVLIVKVRPEVLETQRLPSDLEGKHFWDERYQDINMFERHLVRNGTIVLKFFLNISKKKQKERLLKRLEDPSKNWKFSKFDLSERSKWDNYVEAYEDVFNSTSTEWAPWYIIPADKKWVAHALISEIILAQIKGLDLKFPSLSKEQLDDLENAKVQLQKE
jgi:PPK2 family polyphosphate:nucleotide phosphotransferase